MNSLSILPDSGRTRVFVCPACGETIALGCERCRFCSIAIDPDAAAAAADLMDRVNLACSEAEDIRALLSLQRTSLELFSTSRSRVDVYLLLVPFRLARWWSRFGSLRLEDEDLIRARHDMKLYSWYALLIVAFISLMALLPILRR